MENEAGFDDRTQTSLLHAMDSLFFNLIAANARCRLKNNARQQRRYLIDPGVQASLETRPDLRTASSLLILEPSNCEQVTSSHLLGVFNNGISVTQSLVRKHK